MRSKQKVFFFEKKNQKTFDYWGCALRQRTPIIKSFLLLFFKKEVLPSLAAQDNDVAGLKADMQLMKWMRGFLLAFQFAIAPKLFVHWPGQPR